MIKFDEGADVKRLTTGGSSRLNTESEASSSYDTEAVMMERGQASRRAILFLLGLIGLNISLSGFFGYLMAALSD